MIQRLPQYAERKFALLCSAAGARAHKAEEDESGWDYLVEFPELKRAGPADTHPPSKSAYVQVKSTTSGKLSSRIKLSNALRAAQSRQPWFVVLIVLNADGQSTRIYAMHIWSDLMSAILEKVRKAENANRALHKDFVTLRFEASDEQSDGLLQWMQGCIDAVGEGYEETKKQFHQNLGYEDCYGIGQVTVEAPTADEIAEGFLGMGSGLKLTKFVYTPSRFGIPDASPQIEGAEGRLVVKPTPVDDCEIRLTSSYGNIVLPGKVYSFVTPDMPMEQRRLRFSAKFLDVISKGKSEPLKFILKLSFDDMVDLQTLCEFCTVRAWLGREAADLQVWSGGRRMLAGALDIKKTDPDESWFQITALLSFIRRVAGVSDKNIRLCLNEIVSISKRVRLFQALNDDANLRLEFIPFEKTPDKINSLIYYSRTKLGNWSFFLLARRPVVVDEMIEGGKRQITCGKPILVDSYALENANAEQEQMIHADYERYLAKRERKRKSR